MRMPQDATDEVCLVPHMPITSVKELKASPLRRGFSAARVVAGVQRTPDAHQTADKVSTEKGPLVVLVDWNGSPFAHRVGFTQNLFHNLENIQNHLSPDYLIVALNQDAKCAGKCREACLNLKISVEEHACGRTVDMIASLVRKAHESMPNCNVLILSKNSVLSQLVGANVSLLNPAGKGKFHIQEVENEMIDKKAVFETWGVAPEQIPDFFTLVGRNDWSGVPGIGRKGAAKMLQAYGDLEGVLTAVEQRYILPLGAKIEPKMAMAVVKHVTEVQKLRLALSSEESKDWEADVNALCSVPLMNAELAASLLKHLGDLDSVLLAAERASRGQLLAVKPEVFAALGNHAHALRNARSQFNLRNDLPVRDFETRQMNLSDQGNISKSGSPSAQVMPPARTMDAHKIERHGNCAFGNQCPGMSEVLEGRLRTGEQTAVSLPPEQLETSRKISEQEAARSFSLQKVVELPKLEQTRGVTVVSYQFSAERALEVLMAETGRIFAVTFCLARDGSLQSFSIYGGEDIDFGSGPRLWVQLGDAGASNSLLIAFKPFFESEAMLKIYHNFSQVRSILHMENVSHQGFAGDTMHMARLWDPALGTNAKEDFSLSQLTGRCLGSDFQTGKLSKLGFQKLQEHMPVSWDWIDECTFDAVALFYLHHDLKVRLQILSWRLEGPQELPAKLGGTMWDFYKFFWLPFGELLTEMELEGIGVDVGVLQNLEIKASEERINLDKCFREWVLLRQARLLPEAATEQNLGLLNVNSTLHLRHLFYGGDSSGKFPAVQTFVCIPENRTQKELTTPEAQHDTADISKASLAMNTAHSSVEVFETREDALNACTVQELKEELRDRGLKMTGNKSELVARLLLPADEAPVGRARLLMQQHDIAKDEHVFRALQYRAHTNEQLREKLRNRGLQLGGNKDELVARLLLPPGEAPQARKAKEKQELVIHGLGLRPVLFTKLCKVPSVSNEALSKLCKEQASALGSDGVEAIQSLMELAELDAVVQGFISPLQQRVRANRIHTSLNLNTETGRLSSCEPNLQNQPQRSSFQIRNAFVASAGKIFIIADYSQLELRVLAHLSDCKPMISAIEAGGDFHSRTAANMFSSVAAAVKAGDVLLEENSEGTSSTHVPTIKKAFPVQRNQAKTLNFSVLYGKTSWGLAKDWGLSEGEAQDIIKRWYDAHPGVKEWQERMKAQARETGFIPTMLGRCRRLRGLAKGSTPGERSHALRAAINTPVQGSAADIVTAAMLELWRSPELKRLGFRQVLQVHDELLLEGPVEVAEEALSEVIRIMEDPLPFKLAVPLVVDARISKTWGKGGS
eukprot:gnl/MRDRNA2_/MRDRNA2_98357_c0_seq1.p1 gnl/MRDRNA2_/MRDRNA2_98357_c0~~gnl/MRDRNA2_/MRDRNA2_98357_c0_seq1.p1  ORF type:complete len:1314 (+),score=275.68 gnl/MRDRNA2_/MRDRNA2_98357_c0_seq1:3-3944(+)